VKINNLTNSLIATLLLASPIVGAETQYPAADFEPKVVYQDAEYISQNKPASAAVSTKEAKQTKAVEVDSKYPAADFEPKVLYKDPDYKPSAITERPSVSERTTTTDDAAVTGVEKVEEESMLSYLLGLAVFAVAGYAFLRKREQKVKASGAPVYSGHISGLSGVARYMRKHNMSAVTGVARYLESQVISAKDAVVVSGVEKYLEKQAESVKEKAAQAGTGVEKYMRDRG